MRQWQWSGLVVLVGVVLATGRGLASAADMSPGVIAAASVVFQEGFDGASPPALTGGRVVAPQSQPADLCGAAGKPSAALSVDVEGRTTSFAAGFQVPPDEPAYIVFDAGATKPGRLVLHVQPAEMPKDLADKVQTRDWADPHRQYDMRALIGLEPGKWRGCAIDLNKRIFEAVTRDKNLYDLAGMKIKAIGFEVNQPAESGQQVLIDNVRVIALNGMARRAWVQGQMEQLRGALEGMPASLPIAQYWRRVVSELNMEAMGLDPDAPPAAWRDLSGRIDSVILGSHKWELARNARLPYLVGTETSLRRVSGRNALHAFDGQIRAPVKLEAAGNEYESFQVVLMPLTQGLKDVRIQCSDLTAGVGETSIPARNVAICHQIEQFIQPSLRTTDEQVGWTPDALLPVAGAFDVKDVETKPLWVTLYVPADAAPGDYSGKITIRPGNAPEQSVNVQVKVYGFAIPKVGQFRTQGHFSIEAVEKWYGAKYSPVVRKAFYRLMVEHRFSPTSQYSRMLSPVEEDIPWVMKEGGNVIVIGGYHTKPLEPAKIDGWYKWLVENKYIDMALIYIGDETDDYKGIQAKARMIRKNWPKLRIMVGGSKPRPELIGYVDVWDPITSGGNIYDFDPAGAKEAQTRGEEVFWYTCIGPRQPYANVCNDDPLTAVRALWWQAWTFGVTGFEYWGMNQWGLNMDLAGPDASRSRPGATGSLPARALADPASPNDGYAGATKPAEAPAQAASSTEPAHGASEPWPLGRTDEWNPRSYAWCNGDGLMVYPGPDGRPLSCNRFSVMRDAIEDWEALFMLQRAAELAQKGEAPAQVQLLAARARALLAVPEEITTDLTHWSEDPQVYLRNRHHAYELLAALRDRLGAKEVDAYTARWVEDHHRWMQGKFEERVAKTARE
jgi:hypothetical protein